MKSCLIILLKTATEIQHINLTRSSVTTSEFLSTVALTVTTRECSIFKSKLFWRGMLCYVVGSRRLMPPGCTAAEGLLYKPWSLVVPTCTARCLHQRP